MKNLFVKITGLISILIFLFIHWNWGYATQGPVPILYLSIELFLVIISIHLGISFLRVKSLDKIDKIIFGINLLITIIILLWLLIADPLYL